MTRTDEIKDRLSRGFYATDNLHAPSDIAYLLDAAEAAAWRGGAAAEAKEAEVARLKADVAERDEIIDGLWDALDYTGRETNRLKAEVDGWKAAVVQRNDQIARLKAPVDSVPTQSNAIEGKP